MVVGRRCAFIRPSSPRARAYTDWEPSARVARTSESGCDSHALGHRHFRLTAKDGSWAAVNPSGSTRIGPDVPRVMKRALIPALFVVLAPSAAFAAGVPVGTAAFPLPKPEAATALSAESTPVVAQPAAPGGLPVPPPPSVAPLPAAAPTAEQVGTTWEIVSVRRLAPAWNGSARDASPAPLESKRVPDLWMLSLEAVTRAPVDVGGQLLLETPVGLRLFGGYGWLPSMYVDKVVGVASAVSSDPLVATILENGFQSGRAWRIGAGWRPFRSVGVYLDAGYAHVDLHGELSASDFANVPGLSGGYTIDSSLELGFVELGYQAKIAERVVLGLALGATKVMSSRTLAAPIGGIPEDPRINEATAAVDSGIEKYGILPTLTLRLGADLI